MATARFNSHEDDRALCRIYNIPPPLPRELLSMGRVRLSPGQQHHSQNALRQGPPTLASTLPRHSPCSNVSFPCSPHHGSHPEPPRILLHHSVRYSPSLPFTHHVLLRQTVHFVSCAEHRYYGGMAVRWEIWGLRSPSDPYAGMPDPCCGCICPRVPCTFGQERPLSLQGKVPCQCPTAGIQIHCVLPTESPWSYAAWSVGST